MDPGPGNYGSTGTQRKPQNIERSHLLDSCSKTRPHTYPIEASLALGRIGLGPYSRDKEVDERYDLCEEHGRQR
jgi:hypothetical protein